MAHVIVVQHEPGEGPGALLPALKAAGLQARLVRTWIEEPMPALPGAASGVVVLGGGASAVSDRRPAALDAEIALLRASCQAGLPVLGLCLGGQLLAAALGAEVARAPRREVGFLRVRLSEAAREDALFAGLPASFVAFHLHEDEFALPAGATALASSTQTPVQAFRAGSAWGIQFHPEVTQAELSAMVESAPQDLGAAGTDPSELLEAAARELQQLGPLFARWAALAAGRSGR